MKSGQPSKIIILVYVITGILWLLFVWKTQYTATLEGPSFSYFLRPFLVGMTLLPLIGGIIGLRNSFKWGGIKSVVGRSSLALSLGLIAWSGGMVIWNYYLFFTEISVPYPSAADIIFILSWPLWTYGIWELSEAVGIKFAWQKVKKGFLIIPLLVTLFSVYLLMYVARGGVTYENFPKLFFDLFYPLGDIVILTVTVSIFLLLRKFLGGIYKVPIFILLFGFLLNYISDFLFSYTTTKETYFNGHVVDFLFMTTMFVLSIGLSMLNPSILNSKEVK